MMPSPARVRVFIALATLAISWACVALALGDNGGHVNGEAVLPITEPSQSASKYSKAGGSEFDLGRKLMGTGGDCSICPTKYDPVVDAVSGLPFYNDCLGRCQLGADAQLVPADTAATAKAAKLANKPAADSAEPDLARLLPPPATDGNDTSAAAQISLEAMNRFKPEGFVYVGRQGWAPGRSAPLERDAAPKESPAQSGPVGRPVANAPIVALRMVYPQGDMYMKVISKAEKDKLVAKYTKPKSPDAILARQLAGNSQPREGPPSPQPDEGPADRRSLLGIIGTDDRREVRTLSYPYTTMARMQFEQYDGTRWNVYGCSSSLVGKTGRLGLTAAHCLFNYAGGRALGWSRNIWATPGLYAGGWTPYKSINVDYASVITSWTTSGDWRGDIGWFRLAYHYGYPGTLGYGYTCGTVTYSLTTAGYPGDKPWGTLWTQPASTVRTDVCTQGPAIRFNFDVYFGQSGSPFWTSDLAARMVVSNSGSTSNGATAITATYFSILSSFVTQTIETTPKVILAGGQNWDLFIRCDTSSWKCFGAPRSSATQFYAYPILATNKFALRVPGTTLCLNLNGGGTSGDVNLYPCNSKGDYSFAANELWSILSGYSSAGGIDVIRSDSGALLWWTGSGQQLKGVNACWLAWQCVWHLVYA